MLVGFETRSPIWGWGQFNPTSVFAPHKTGVCAVQNYEMTRRLSAGGRPCGALALLYTAVGALNFELCY